MLPVKKMRLKEWTAKVKQSRKCGFGEGLRTVLRDTFVCEMYPGLVRYRLFY